MVAQKMEDKDPAIKLFGKKIPVPADVEDFAGRSSDESSEMDEDRDHTEMEKPHNKGWSTEDANGCSKQGGVVVVDEEEEKLGEISPPDHQKTNSQDDRPAGGANALLKKPDKILPCPRCSSMDTKFCYYNNYNMNQPRHFCRACQRYWTAGGTMRNVPVGAGRRKNKNNSSNSHYTHITISDALQAVQIIDTTHVQHHHPALKTINGSTAAAVLSFGAPNGKDQQVAENGFTAPVVPGFWQYPAGAGGHVFYNPTAGSLPVQAGYWNCGTLGSVPFLSPDSHKSCCDHPSAPKLGKHSRDDDDQGYSCLKQGEDLETNQKSPRQKNGNVLIPKTLRIDDPNDAAKSSIWETLGIKNESLSGGGMFRGYFKSKSTDHRGKKISCVAETTSLALLANPAAFSRSISFQETS